MLAGSGIATHEGSRTISGMPTAICRKPVTRRRVLSNRGTRLVTIEPIPIHPPGGLPVSDFELKLEKLAGADLIPEFAK